MRGTSRWDGSIVFVAVLGIVSSVLAGRPAVAATVAGGERPAVLAAAPAASPPVNVGLAVAATTSFEADIADPQGITAGPDGNLWFTSRANHIGRMTPAGVVSTFTDATVKGPTGITVGPDGALWFANTTGNSIGRITTAGVLTNFPAAGLAPLGITAGPDGALWFTNSGDTTIGRLTTAGVLSSFTGAGVNQPRSIVTGPDGALWFTNRGTDSIGRITVGGAVTSFTDPTISMPEGITVGGDGNLWFANHGTSFAGSIGRITPAGAVTAFALNYVGNPTAIAAGPDGNVWALESPQSRIDRITPSGTVTTFVDGTVSNPSAIASGPNGALWFANWGRDSIGRVTTAGVVTEFPGRGISDPIGITAGPDGNVWFTNTGNDSIERITPAGVITRFTAPGIDQLAGITAGPDGNLWFPASMNAIGRITPAGVITLFKDPTTTGVAVPVGITTGPDGNLWFTNTANDSIGRITPAGSILSPLKDPSVTAVRHIVAGPDGNVWFTEPAEGSNPGAIGRVTPAGVITNFSGSGIAAPTGIIAGPDGTVWFTNANGPLAHITTNGVVTTIGVWTGPGIANGGDGNVWASALDSSVVRVTPAGAVTTFPGSTGGGTTLTTGPDGNVWFAQVTDRVGWFAVTGLPSTPPTPTAVAGNQSATVTWSPPGESGGLALTYTVIASPGGSSCSWTSGPYSCVVNGLTSGTSYTFRVTAVNAAGSSLSAASQSVIPWSGSSFHPLVPARLLDSRTSTGGWSGPLVAGVPRGLGVQGAGGVATSASAAVLNITVTNGSAGSFLTVWPGDAAQPSASNLNFGSGATVPNQVVVRLGAAGQIMLANAVGSVDVIVDVVGYFDPGTGDKFDAMAPTRFLDSRTSVGGWNGPIRAGVGNTRTLGFRGVRGVAITATAVVLNVTVTNATAGSFLQIWPSGSTRPNSSSLNFGPGQTVANLVTARLGTGGVLSFYNDVGDTDVIVDVVGYYDRTNGSRFHALPAPVRILDDRTNIGLSGPFAAGVARVLPVRNVGGIGSDAAALVANLTATNGTAGSFLTLYPSDTSLPTSSSLNFGPGQTIANLTVSKVSGDGQVAIYNHQGTVDVIADAVGYFAYY